MLRSGLLFHRFGSHSEVEIGGVSDSVGEILGLSRAGKHSKLLNDHLVTSCTMIKKSRIEAFAAALSLSASRPAQARMLRIR